MKLKANVYMTPAFGKSLVEVMNIKRLPVEVKFSLARLKKTLAEEIQVLRDSTEGMEGTELMGFLKSHETEFDFKPFDAKLIQDLVTANDLFNLEPLLEVKDDRAS